LFDDDDTENNNSYSFKHGAQLFLVSSYFSGGTLKEVLGIHGGRLGVDHAR
jgi:hypothetical protein